MTDDPARQQRRVVRVTRSGGSGGYGGDGSGDDGPENRDDFPGPYDGHDLYDDRHPYDDEYDPFADAITDRHFALSAEDVGGDGDGDGATRGRADAGEGRDDGGDHASTGPDMTGWLLGSSDDDHGERSIVASSDAITEALPHGRTAARQARRRRRVLVVVGAVLAVALIGGIVLARGYLDVFFPPDYDGPGSGRSVVQVVEGESTREIGEALVAQDVVASARAFGDAAEDDPDGRGVQPGFYELRRQMSAAQAVGALLDPANRLGRLEIRPGTQLDDTAGPDNTTLPGVLSLVARATCRVGEGGDERCASVDELRRVMATTDPAGLGVPTWAAADVRRADPPRRLEGLLGAGTYDIAPGSPARDALAQVVRESVPRLEATGVVERSRAAGVSAYEALVIASLAEKEGVAGDFGKVARVIYNRLNVPMRLQFDSTINYPLDKQALLTTPADRGRPGPYNSYLNLGLPPTPIAAPSRDAVRAALEPAPGAWVYFVKCQVDGESCFANTQPEHDANRRLAQDRGVY